GSYGTRGVGYEIARLIRQIEQVLGLTQQRNVALIGIGNLGHALAGYAGFVNRGSRVSALVDADPARVGERLGDITVTHIDDLAATVAEKQITIGVITTPASAAQEVADRLVRSEEHTSELQSRENLVCRLLLEKKKKKNTKKKITNNTECTS